MEPQPDVAALLRDQVIPTAIDALRNAGTARERERAAFAATEAVLELRAAVVRVRRDALLEMSESGMTWAQIGAAVGTTGVRAHQIAHGRKK